VVALAAFVRPSAQEVASTPPVSVPSIISDPTASTERSLDSTPTEPTDTDSSGDPDTTPPLPTEGYVVSYQDQKLVLRPNYSQGCSGRHVDLDAPGIVVDPNAPSDISYDPCNNSGAGPTLDFPPQVAEVSSSSATAADCSKTIRTAPSAQTQTVSRQLVLCTTTDGISTAGQPARSRMVRILVDGVQKDGTVTLTLTSWEIPS